MEPINYKLARRVIYQCRNAYPHGLSLREIYLRGIRNKSQAEIRVVEQLVKMRSLESTHITGNIGRPTTRYHLSTAAKKMKLFIWCCPTRSNKRESCGTIAETRVEAKSVFEWWCSENGYFMESGDITEFECGDVVCESFTLIV